MSDANRTHGLGTHEVSVRRSSATLLVGLTAATVVLLSLGGDDARMLLRYERSAVLTGHEYWRLVTAHWVHGSMLHAGLNLAGLAVIALLFPRQYSLATWVAIVAVSTAAIDGGFIWNEPQLEWYVGLSGVLHGALAAGTVGWWRTESRLMALALTAILVGKLAWEQWAGALPLSGDMPVIVNAHLYGAIGGALAALGSLAIRHGWLRIVRPL